MAGQTARLELNLGLNLDFFRQSLAKATAIAASEFTPKINLQFNRQTIDRELNGLQRSIGRRVYRIELQSNFKTEAQYAERIAAVVPALEKAAAAFKQINKSSGGGQAVIEKAIKDQTSLQARLEREFGRKGGAGGGYSAAAISRMYDEASRQGLAGITKNAANREARAKELAVAFASMGKNAANSFIDSFNQDINKGAKAGQELGKKTYEGLKKELRSASPSKKMMELGKDASDGFVIGLNQGLDDVEKYAQKIKAILDGVAKSIATTGKSIANVQGKRLGLGNIPLMAGSLEGRVERSASAIGGAGSTDALRALYPSVNRTIASLATLREQVQQNTSKLSGFSLIIGLAAFAGVPLAKSIVTLTGSANDFAKLLDRLGLKLEDAFTKATLEVLKSSSGRLLGQGGLAGLLPPAYRGIGPAAGPAGLLGGGASPAGLLPPAYRGIGGVSNIGLLPQGQQKYLPTDLSDDLKRILREAAYAFLDSIRQNIRKVNVEDMGRSISRQPLLSEAPLAGFLPGRPSQASVLELNNILAGAIREYFKAVANQIRPPSGGGGFPLLGGGRNPLMLPPAGGTSAGVMAPEYQMRVTTGQPYSQGAVQGPSRPGRNAVQSFGQQMMGTQLGSLPQLPGAAGVKELGSEFKYATQQLVLFGTVYKGLAFLQNFPREVMASVGALQTYRNSLEAVTGSSEAFAVNNEYILGLVDKYNIPLEAARQGFVKLYASMAPAGFTGTEIRGLFEAVSQGAATFGMSSDQVDRVINSFAQMASKGQVMAEELKGQLGDVLPGAFALFAQAAGYKGSAAIAQFSKAMENGEFKGAKMRELLLNVKEVMNKEFGPGAEGAARTFQGAMNRMNTSVKLFYEAFEPLAVQFLNTFVVPISNGLRIATEGFTQFFTGVAAQSSGGREFGAALESLRPAFDGIAANVSSLLPQLKLLGGVLLEVGKIFLQIAGNPITGFFLRIYAAILPLQVAFNVLRVNALLPLIGAFVRFIGTIPLLATNFRVLIGSVLSYNAATAAGVGQQAAMKAALIQTGLGAQQAAAGFRAAGTALKIFSGLATGGLLIGLGLIIERFASMKAALDGIAGAARGVSSSLASMSRSGDIAGINQLKSDLGDEFKTFQKIRDYASKTTITARQKAELDKLGLGGYTGKAFGRDSFYIADQAAYLKVVDERIKSINANINEIPQKLQEAEVRAAKARAQELKDAQQARAVGGGTGEAGKPGKPTTLDASAISGLQKDAAAIRADFIAEQFDAAMARIQMQIGRGAGVFEPFVDAYTKILEFNKKSSDAAVDLMKLQAQGTAQEIKASNTAARNAGKGLNLKTGAQFGGFPITDVPGSPRTYRNGTHEGYDIGTPIGTAISYAIGGVVKSIDKVGRGNAGKLVEVQLENGIVGLSMHLSEVLVSVGQKFQAGQIIAKTGDTGAGPAHLHQESAARAYKTGGAGASLAYLQLNGRGAAGKGGVVAPSMGQVAEVNQEQMIARQRALTAALSKDAAELYNAFAELNSADISSRINEQLFNLGESIKRVKRDTEDAAMNFLPDTAVNQVSKNIKRIERELEDLPAKYRDIQVTIQKSMSGAEFSKFIGTKEFRESDAVKKFTNELKTLGVTEAQVQAILDAGTQSREALAVAIDSLSAATRAAVNEQEKFLKLEIEIQRTFGNRKAVLQGQSNALSAFGLPTRNIDIAQKKLELDEQITRQQYAYADAVEKGNAEAIQSSLQQIDLLNQQKGAYNDLIPGIVTFGEATQIAFQPAVDSFYDFITGAKSASEAFRGFAYSVISSLAKMAAQAAIMQVFKGIFSIFGGGGFFGFANGGIADGGFQAFANGGIADGGIQFKAFASGGTVSGPTLGLVGEGRYNEAVVPLPDGKSIPVSMKGGGGGGEAININIAVDATGSKVQGNEGEAGKLASAISTAVQSELVKQKRPGGLLA